MDCGSFSHAWRERGKATTQTVLIAVAHQSSAPGAPGREGIAVQSQSRQFHFSQLHILHHTMYDHYYEQFPLTLNLIPSFRSIGFQPFELATGQTRPCTPVEVERRNEIATKHLRPLVIGQNWPTRTHVPPLTWNNYWIGCNQTCGHKFPNGSLLATTAVTFARCIFPVHEIAGLLFAGLAAHSTDDPVLSVPSLVS